MNAGSGARPSRAFRVAAAVGVCCYVLAAACGMYVLAGGLSPFLQVCLWGVHGVVLALLLRRLGPTHGDGARGGASRGGRLGCGGVRGGPGP
ncbi:hypothetical protein ACIQU7_25830 [Streptomyces albidoflavus]|uniref:hypothetical protein n=1 Tax=Streptomyces albidoflavus TaxID=1886 RepID=UPI003820F9A0